MKEIIILKNANSRPLSVDSFQRPKMNGRSRAMLASSGGNFFFFFGGGGGRGAEVSRTETLSKFFKPENSGETE